MRTRQPLKVALGILLAVGLASLILLPALALIGDVDLNNRVDRADLSAIAQRLGLRSSDANYLRPLDLNLDDEVNVQDLAIAGRSYGASRIFHYLRQISNCQNCAANKDSCLDGLGRVNVVWSSGYPAKVYFSRLDRFGNTLIDDVLLDTGQYADSVAVGCDEGGNAHVLWVTGSKLHQARFDRWGYPVIAPQVVYGESVDGNIGDSGVDMDLDSQGNAYAFFRRAWRDIPTVARIEPSGQVSWAAQGVISGTNTLYRQIAADEAGNLHLMWYELEGPDRVYYARHGADDSPSISQRVVGYTDYDGSINQARQPDLEVDSLGNAYLVWRKSGTSNLFLEKIAPNGDTVLDDLEIFAQWESNGYTPSSDIALDGENSLHLLSLTGWGRSVSHSAYGIFSPDGAPLSPMRWFYYGTPMQSPEVLVDDEADVHVTFQSSSSSGYPPCANGALCYLGTAFRTEVYDLSRSDLGVDAAHLSYTPLITRWGGTLAITITVFNEGWAAAPASSLLVALETSQGERLAQSSPSLSALSLHQAQTLTNIQLQLPALPPTGMEEMEYLRLRLEVDPGNTISETSEENNLLLAPILVQKLPTQTGLFLIVRDDTNTVRGGIGERLNVGAASIHGGSYSRTNIPVTDYVTLLGDDIPVGPSLVTYTVGWQAPGYAAPTPVGLGVQRNASDPYQIDYAPGNTAVLVTNRWGSLSGSISQSDGSGGPLAGAIVRLTGQGLSIQTTTDENGSFAPTAEATLGTLIPGPYQIRVSRAGYARLTDTVTIVPLGTHVYSQTMQPTDQAYLHGNVRNTLGNPVVGATVSACAAVTQTDAQGVFDLTVSATCTSMAISRTGYATLGESLSLVAGLESLFTDLEMTFDPPLNVFSKDGRVGSRVIDQSSGDLLPEPPEDASWVEKQIYDQFKDKFWAEYRIYIAYGGYEYNAAAAYSGPSDDRRMNYVQVRFDPKTFEVHMLLASVEFAGVPIPLPLVSDSGETSAIRVIEARLVNAETGQVLKRVYDPIEGAASESILDDTILTYDFGSQAISDWGNTEVWLYYKVGKNENGQLISMPQLYQHDRQIIKFDLSDSLIWIDYGLGEFPLP